MVQFQNKPTKADLEQTIAEYREAMDAKDKSLQTFIIIVCGISGLTLLGGGAFVGWFFFGKKKLH